MNVFNIRYNIQCTLFLKKKTPTGLNPRIVIPSSPAELKKLAPIVIPFIIPEMLYKVQAGPAKI